MVIELAERYRVLQDYIKTAQDELKTVRKRLHGLMEVNKLDHVDIPSKRVQIRTGRVRLREGGAEYFKGTHPNLWPIVSVLNVTKLGQATQAGLVDLEEMKTHVVERGPDYLVLSNRKGK